MIVNWLTDDGLFVAHLDLNNLRHGKYLAFGRKAVQALRDASLTYQLATTDHSLRRTDQSLFSLALRWGR